MHPLFRTPWRIVAVVTAVAAAAVGAAAFAWSDAPPSVHRIDEMFTMPVLPGSGETVRIDASYYTTGDAMPEPAVLLAHGFGGGKQDTMPEALFLAQRGYRVLTWSARGFGDSTGQIGLDSPDREVADAKRLIDWLGHRPDVLQDGPDDPRVGIAGASYGGALALLTAGYDHRVDAIAPQITWWDLRQALFPNGVFKKLWAGIFFTTASGRESGCAFTAELCRAYQQAAVSGAVSPAAMGLLEQSSPSSVAARIKAPALITQGQEDSLFPLGQADEMARAIAANGAPVSVDWSAGGHDGGDRETGRVEARTLAWFDRYLKRDRSMDTGPAFRVTRTGGLSTSSGTPVERGVDAAGYPGLGGTSQYPVTLTGDAQTVANPAGGMPPAVSAVPGLGALAQLSSAAGGLSFGQDFPGQYAAFDSAPLASTLRVAGAATVRVTVSAATTAGAVLFAKVYDVAPDGTIVLPDQLVTPLRVSGPGTTTVAVDLPAIDHGFAAGHRLRLVFASTDLGYFSPAAPTTYRVSLPPDDALRVPVDTALRGEQTPIPAWVWILPLAAVAAAALLLTGRAAGRGRAVPDRRPEPASGPDPLVVTGLSKRYRGSNQRYAVQDLSFRVERGQILGLLGPNGAGKTTTLRMLMGLIRPDAGSVHVFGSAVGPGSPVLSRVGAFVEGAGFLPHLTGRTNLRLYWAATGRPEADAHLEEALEIAALGDALDRPVRTYSQGMRQRLAIAQAMLGLPDLLILDEPTNGLDPQQIREMRSVITRYAAGGRTVIVSSHLLAEVEQTCTHLVVMDQGRLRAAGPVTQITGSGDALLVGLAADAMTPAIRESVARKVAVLPGVAAAEPAGRGLLIRLDGLPVADLLAELLALAVPVESVGPQRRLEDAFLTLTGEPA